MLVTTAKVAALAVLATQASAKTIQINVGKDGLKFTPDSVTAAVGDMLEYHFWGQHSVATGDFTDGCTPSTEPDKSYFSGVMRTAGSGENGMVFQVEVNSTEPSAIYCTVARHCQGGMVGVINPSATDSLEKLQSISMNASANRAPPSMFGGKMANSSMTSQSGAASLMQASSLGSIGAVLGFAAFLM